jgi:tetratricopeptide (TPR) repeat protein
MSETPNFRQIAELFQVPVVDVPEDDETSPKRLRGKNAEESEELAKQRLTEGNHEAAVRHFKQAISQRGRETTETLVDLGGAYDYGDQAPQALRQYEKALRLQKDAVEPQVGLSDLLKRYGRYRDSIERLQQALNLEPENPHLLIKLAETLRDMGERTRALDAVQKAISLKPDEAFYHYWAGDLLISMDRFEEALDAVRASIELSPGDDYLYVRAAVAFWGAGRRPEAIKAIRLASDLDPLKHFYHGVLEKLLNEMSLPDEAVLEHERASKMDRYDLDTLDRLLSEMGIAQGA